MSVELMVFLIGAAVSFLIKHPILSLAFLTYYVYGIYAFLGVTIVYFMLYSIYSLGKRKREEELEEIDELEEDMDLLEEDYYEDNEYLTDEENDELEQLVASTNDEISSIDVGDFEDEHIISEESKKIIEIYGVDEETVKQVIEDEYLKENNEDDKEFNDLIEEDEEVNPPIDSNSVEPNGNEVNLWIPDDFIEDDDSPGTSHTNVDDSLAVVQNKLDNLIGMDSLKSEVRRLMNYVKLQKLKEEQGKQTKPLTLHMAFLGDAGTGKTTVARIIAEFLKSVGFLESGHLVETDRSGLVGQYVGQTAQKTLEKVDEAEGGVLFIDEAYALAGGGPNDFGKEAIDILIKAMEDKRDNFVVILAGYSNEIKELFNLNPGFESRVPFKFEFPSYDLGELMDIFEVMLKSRNFKIEHEAEFLIKNHFAELIRSQGYVKGNGRYIRNFVDQLELAQANRIVNMENLTDEIQELITIEDVNETIQFVERMAV